ncbi:hypothetical protein HUN01_24545 [Nostoc edaphicum CCNP1411]|uniref:Uncharacterized protein n=1 Tax=Nostoc edaphicum CCNP1411 TaxID=1472755 RepID=A0A7D7LFF8_9NOSO|nr:hypothetical protein [Nostoc edaphicum]QMS90594.1 hypothetical protein HUN01_24545 [Nostoc edaphicum CCNP1411]
MCYGFRNAPKSSDGALAYGITHPTQIFSEIKYDSYMRELEEKNQDLIDESEERDEADKASLSFRWKHKLQKYNIE